MHLIWRPSHSSSELKIEIELMLFIIQINDILINQFTNNVTNWGILLLFLYDLLNNIKTLKLGQ